MGVDIKDWICPEIKKCKFMVTEEYLKVFCLDRLCAEHCYYKTYLELIPKLNPYIFQSKIKHKPITWLKKKKYQLPFTRLDIKTRKCTDFEVEVVV